jgi:hypothetical protein
MSKGSSIVFLTSLAAHAVVGTSPTYAATKGAVDTLVKHFAWRTRYPRQCRGAGRRRNGHVDLHQDGGWPGLRAGHAGAEALMAMAPRSGAGTSFKLPPKVPIAVRTGVVKITDRSDAGYLRLIERGPTTSFGVSPPVPSY